MSRPHERDRIVLKDGAEEQGTGEDIGGTAGVIYRVVQDPRVITRFLITFEPGEVPICVDYRDIVQQKEVPS